MPPVPSLQLPAVDDAPLLRSPRTEEWRSSLYQKSSTTPEAQRVASLTASPRSIQLYSPRTHAEQLEVTGSELDDALEAAKHLRERLGLLSERARRDRAAFAAAMGSSDQEEHCPICMESISEPRECENKHTFCAECLRSYRRATHRSPRLLCPLCAATACTHALLCVPRPAPWLRAPSLFASLSLTSCMSCRARVQVKYGTRPSAGAF